jgi:hypothetical protein
MTNSGTFGNYARVPVSPPGAGTVKSQFKQFQFPGTNTICQALLFNRSFRENAVNYRPGLRGSCYRQPSIAGQLEKSSFALSLL